MSGLRLTGQIQRLIPDRAFAFIRTPDGKEYFLHASAMTDGPEAFKRLTEGDVVTFVETQTHKGPRAIDVEQV